MRVRVMRRKHAGSDRLHRDEGAGLCAASVAALLLGGCNVGPKYVKPTAPAPPEYQGVVAGGVYQTLGELAPGEHVADLAAGEPQDAALKGKWWEIFNEPELNALEEQLNINNQNIAEYFQNFMAARAVVREARSQFFPTVTTDPSFTRQKTPATLSHAWLRLRRVERWRLRVERRRRRWRCRLMCRGSRIFGERFATRCVNISMRRR